MKKVMAFVFALMLVMAFALGCKQKPAEEPATHEEPAMQEPATHEEPAMQEEQAPAPAEQPAEEHAAPAESAH